ncbi:patatin-like phospholipase family protein [Cereibacter sphaeroides]|uniref:patatin-like phospholipase family protein n=1 Tax=Cereibacter sphaeroides TaxID=1063 RepID=UPI0039904F62
MASKTQFFSNCAAVFEGGGVRAAAFAGAYAAASEAGIGFVRVAGTSAGSIVAALIAAGATPSYVSDKLLEKDFKDFLIPPAKKDAAFAGPSSLTRMFSSFFGGQVKEATFLSQYAGFYKSDGIREWVESMLKELLLPNKADVAHRPVRFSDLLLPCTIVSADIAVAGARIWSKESTPHDDVAYAVQCSSSIPFFFQPVRETSHLMVDGGMLSNLPAFVYAGSNPAHRGRFSERILAFRLKDDGSHSGKKIDSILEFGSAIANTIVEASTAIQLGLQPDVFTINIPAGSIQATDFSEIGVAEKEALCLSGRQAVTEFVNSERGVVSKLRTDTTYKGFEERLLVYVQMLSNASQCVWISDQSSYWIWFVFPSVFSALRRNVDVHFVTTAPREDHTFTDEIQRRILLSRMGVRLHIVDETHFIGVLRDPNTDHEAAALSSVQGYMGVDYKFEAERVRIYSAEEDSPVVESIRRGIVVGRRVAAEKRTFTIQPCCAEKLVSRLGKIPQYTGAKFEMIEVDLESQIGIIQKFVKEYKFMQIDSLIGDFKRNGLELFHPQELLFADGSTSIISPPVFEVDNDRLILIDGHTRTFHCLKNGVRRIRAVIAKNVGSPLPGTPLDLRELCLVTGTTSMSDNMNGLNRTHFRKIDEALRPHEPDSEEVYMRLIADNGATAVIASE